MASDPHVLILAAGKGKRMASSLPKVLHPVLFRPMIHYVLDLAHAIPHGRIAMVVGHGETSVREHCRSYPDVEFIQQKEQLGSGHAVKMAEPVFAGQSGSLVILSGDVILLERASLLRLVREHARADADCTLTTARVAEPMGYGRILRAADGGVAAIREEADCSGQERGAGGMAEVNAGIYCFRIASLFEALRGVSRNNRQKEFYLTDTVAQLVGRGKRVSAFILEDPAEMTGINDRKTLYEVESRLQARLNDSLMMQGATMQAPRTTFIDAASKIGKDVTIEAGCRILRSTIESGVLVEAGSRIVDSYVASDSHIKQGSYLEKSRIGAGSVVGPYAHLRPGSTLERGVKIGNFVEMKNSRMGEGSKASHLSYIGDAEVGREVNLGCGFITCNYDGGPVKHRTIIEDEVFVGSDSQMVAPVRLGEGSYIASGTTVTQDVPPGALAVGRVRQQNKEGYAARIRRKRSPGKS